MPELTPSGEWTSRIIHLLNDQHMVCINTVSIPTILVTLGHFQGVVTAAVSVINSLVNRSPDEYKGCVSLAVSRLSRIVTASYTDLQDYTYYFVPAPWLSVKLLRLLQNYPPPDDPGVRGRLNECLETILNKAQEPPKSKKVQHSNAKNAILFEAISLIIHMDSEPNLLVRACNQLGQFLQHRETNLRYLALESMCLLATSEFSHDAVKKHQDTVINALKVCLTLATRDCLTWLTLPDRKRRECETKSCRFVVCHVRQIKLRGDCTRNACLLGNRRLLYTWRNGTQSRHFGGEIRLRLHLVCGCHSEPNQNRRRLCERRGLVSSHSNCDKPGRCSRICR